MIAPTLTERLLALTAEAHAFVARDKAESLARQFLSGPPPPEPHAQRLMSLALTLARDLALSIPSMLGSTAFDRMARTMKGRTPEDVAAMALLRRGRLRVARLTGERFEDLATGEIATLLPTPISEAIGDGVIFGFCVATPDGGIAFTGTPMPLDAEALALAQSFVRPKGVGLGSGVRCAEALYRHLIRHGVSMSVLAPQRRPKPPFDPDTSPLDALAAAWAALEREPNTAELHQARKMTSEYTLLAALRNVSIAQEYGEPKLASAYTRIAVVQMEAIALRAANGSTRNTLDSIAAAIADGIRDHNFPVAGQHLFNSLRERIKLSAARPANNTADLDRLVQRIQALRAKTVEQGCTEQEALAAAEKVAELLDRYGLNLSELDLRKQTCEGIGIETGRKRRGPIDDCMGSIATFFDCRVWVETEESGTLRYIFFGLPADVQAAVYLHDLIAQAFVTETVRFQAGDLYATADGGSRRTATNSFQIGMARGINQKLKTLRQTREAAVATSSSRALVPIKASMIDDEMELLGMTFTRKSASRRRVLPTAYQAGREAGERFEYRPGLAAD